MTPLYAVVCNGHAVVVEKLISASCGVNPVCDDDGSTPLYAAVSVGDNIGFGPVPLITK